MQKYKIVYDANGAKEAAPIDATEYTLGDKITVSSASMTRDGYIFQCWKNSLEYKPGDTFVLDEAIAAMASYGVLTLTAQWIPTPLQPL